VTGGRERGIVVPGMDITILYLFLYAAMVEGEYLVYGHKDTGELTISFPDMLTAMLAQAFSRRETKEAAIQSIQLSQSRYCWI
jgi:hypothetical protein